MLHAHVPLFLQTLTLVCLLYIYILVFDLPKSMFKFFMLKRPQKARAKRAREKLFSVI